MDLDLSLAAPDLTAQLVDAESVSGGEKPLTDAIEAALRRLPHLTTHRDGNAVVARTSLGRKATLGIRPEDIHVAGPADSAEHCFDTDVEVVEQLGSEILLDTRVGPALMVASIDPSVRVRTHDKLRLALNPARLHLFDAQTERAI